jgi:hypothetical protein
MKSLTQLTDGILEITEAERGDTPPLYILPNTWQPPEDFVVLLKEILTHGHFLLFLFATLDLSNSIVDGGH